MTRILSMFALCLFLAAAQARPPNDEAAIQQLLDAMTTAWNQGDAAALASHARQDITFTILDGSLFQGRDVFESKHRGIFAGAFKGSTLTFKPRRMTFVRTDVALVDIDAASARVGAEPVRSSLLLVLAREGREWKIAGFHNTLQRSLSREQ